MLRITKYYKTILLGFIQNNFSSTETQSVVDRFSHVENKKAFIGDNIDEIIPYLDTLNMDKDGDHKIDEQFLTDSKFLELFKQLGLKTDDLIHGITLKELTDKLNEYKKVIIETNGIVQTEAQSLRRIVNINTIKNSPVSLRRGVKKSMAVQALQNFLINKGFLIGKADSNFGPKTETALKEYQNSKGFKIADGILTVRKGKNGEYFPTMQAIVNENLDGRFNTESATADDVMNAAKKATESIDANIDMLKISKEFFLALEAREDGGKRGDVISDMGSGLGWIREIFGKNNASEYFDKLNIKGNFEKAFDNVNNPKIEEKFNKGYEYLVKDYTTRNNSLNLYGFRDILVIAFAKVPLFDVRLNFAKKLKKSGVGMNKAVLFSEWAQSGMEQSFEEYEKENGKNLDTGKTIDKDLNKLKANVSAYIRSKYNLNDDDINKKVIAELRKTDKKLDEMITTFIQDSFTQDAETMLSGGFNVLEYFFDTKYDTISDKIDILKGGEIKIKTKNPARKEKSSSKKNQDVFLLKNNGKFYLHIGTEYKEFTDKRPSSEDIETAIKQYNTLGLTTHGRSQSTNKSPRKYLPYSIKGKKIIEKAKKEGKSKKEIEKLLIIPEKPSNGWYREDLNKNENEVFISKEAQIKIAHEIMDEFEKQNTKSDYNREGAGKLDGHIEQVEDRLDYYTILNRKNIKFLKEAIRILKAGTDIPKELRQNFGLINIFNSTADFLNAYSALPDDVKNEIKKLDHSKLTPEEYVSKLQELTKTPGVKEALTAIKSGPKAYEKYRKTELYKRAQEVSPEDRVDAGKFKYGARMLTKREFGLNFKDLKEEYRKRYEDLHISRPKDKKIKQEFKEVKTFKEAYSFKKPNTGNLDADYKTYINMLSKTGPNIKYEEESGKYLSSMDLAERGLIEQGIFDITGEQLYSAIADRGEDVPIQSLFEDPGDFINTARQAGTKHDVSTTFRALSEERGDKAIKHVTIDRSYNMVNKDGENVKIDISYDVYDRPECQNVYVLPNSKSIQRTIATLKQNNNMSILNTGTLPILPSMITGLLKSLGGGNGLGQGVTVGAGNSNANGGMAIGGGTQAGVLL